MPCLIEFLGSVTPVLQMRIPRLKQTLIYPSHTIQQSETFHFVLPSSRGKHSGVWAQGCHRKPGVSPPGHPVTQPTNPRKAGVRCPGKSAHRAGFGLEAGSPTQLLHLRPQFPRLAKADRGWLEIRGPARPAPGGGAGSGHVKGRRARGLPPTPRLEPSPGVSEGAVKAANAPPRRGC